MQKLIKYPMLILALFLIDGCGQKSPDPIITAALFCDVEEQRRFTQDEVNWRAAHAPWNLKRDYKTNLTFERECTSEKEK